MAGVEGTGCALYSVPCGGFHILHPGCSTLMKSHHSIISLGKSDIIYGTSWENGEGGL